MPRNMSFALTTEQARDRTKTVTRRLGWRFLWPGDKVQQVVKAMGLKKGEKIEKIHLIEIVSVKIEPLILITQEDVIREGFTAMTPPQFIDMFCKFNRCEATVEPTRIQFRYLD